MQNVKPKLVTLLPATIITGNTATAGTQAAGLQDFTKATVLLTVAAKTMDSSTTMDVYVQYSPDEGTTWDDIAHFAQITNGAIGNGTYVMYLCQGTGAGVADRVTDDADGTLAAGNIRNISWCDRMRIKYDGANFAGTDTVTLTVQSFFQ